MSNLGFGETIKRILDLAKEQKGGRVYCCTLNEVLMVNEEKKMKSMLEEGEIVTPDGMPLVWALRKKGLKGAERVYGPEILAEIMDKKVKQTFIGSEENEGYFQRKGDYFVFPFNREMRERDYQLIIKRIIANKSRLVWVALGSKKQIIVANELFKRLPSRVYLTVGAAFDFVSGKKKQAPRWIRNNGGEWLFRIFQEPRRLYGRYLKIILFIFGWKRKFQF